MFQIDDYKGVLLQLIFFKLTLLRNVNDFILIHGISIIKALRESLKLWRIHLNQLKYCYFFLWFQLTGLIPNKTKYCKIKAFYKPHGVYIFIQPVELFSARVYRYGGQVIFQYKPGAFASKKLDENVN